MRGGDRQRIGLWGEEQAARHLEEKGYEIVARRFRVREGELDLVAIGSGYLCFVEVKLRKDGSMGQAREYVTFSKQCRIRTAAQRYLMRYPSDLQPRFDVVEVYAPQGTNTVEPIIRHWENAF